MIVFIYIIKQTKTTIYIYIDEEQSSIPELGRVVAVNLHELYPYLSSIYRDC